MAIVVPKYFIWFNRITHQRNIDILSHEDDELGGMACGLDHHGLGRIAHAE
jgi:hypothetical protein